ncbi:MAG: hypothetical protein ABIR16_01645, partial [Dokdonella sp.]
TANDLAIAAGMAAANGEDVKAIWMASEAIIAQVQARLDAAYQSIVGKWALPITEPVNIEEATARINQWMADQIAAAEQAAKAAGMQGVSEKDLANIRANAASQIAAANAQFAAAAAATAAAIAAAAEQLEKAKHEYRDFLEGIRRETADLSDFQQAMLGATDWQTNAIARANELARAAGMAGASEQALALIERRAAQMRAAAVAQLRQETQSLIDQLYGVGQNLGDGLSSGIESAQNAADDFWQRQRQNIETLQGYLNSMLLGDLSALTPEQQIAEAWRQLQEAISNGDAGQATQLADTYLRLLRGAEASGADYNAAFFQVRDLLATMLANVQAATPPEVGTPPISYAQAEQVAANNRLELAAQLAQHLRDLAGALNQPIFELIESMGLNLRSLTADLGINLQEITGESVMALANLASMLGVNLSDLTSELGITLADLGMGIRELAIGMGVDLNALTVESTRSLATLANQLGINLSELAMSVGVDLGSLADAQSLLNDALENTINGLPTGTRDQLQPLLEAVENATNEADANAAIAALNAAVNLLAPDIRNLLAPYLEGVFPVDALDDLDFLSMIDQKVADQIGIAVQQLEEMRFIANTAVDMATELRRIAASPASQPGSPSTASTSSSAGASTNSAASVPDGFTAGSNGGGDDQDGMRAAMSALQNALVSDGKATRAALRAVMKESDRATDNSIKRLSNNSRRLTNA